MYKEKSYFREKEQAKLNLMNHDSKTNGRRANHSSISDMGNGRINQDSVSKTEIHPQHKKDLIDIVIACLILLLFIGSMAFLIWFFEVK